MAQFMFQVGGRRGEGRSKKHLNLQVMTNSSKKNPNFLRSKLYANFDSHPLHLDD
jgi:hypothetical protein